MFGNVCRGIPGERYEDLIKQQKADAGVSEDVELDVDHLRALTQQFKELFEEETGEPFPQDPKEQLRQAITAVFDSWTGKRAVEYRRINHIPDEWGTAVNVQQMVFGNKGDSSCSGVAFSRDEITGEPTPSGDFLPNAQGEDVVSGVRTPRDLHELKESMPDAHGDLMEILRTLEKHYGDMQDTEFTVEEGSLYMLQTRNAKRPAQAAVRFAVDAVEEGLLDRAQAIATIDAGRLDALLHPGFKRDADFEVLAEGVPASPGAAKGAIVFTADDAVSAAEDGRDVILVRPFTEADDVAGFHAAKGILTAEGGKASHAALVARGMGKPCVSGAAALDIDLHAKTLSVNGTKLSEGDMIAIDGSAGVVTADDVPLEEPEVSDEFETVLGWADELRTLGIRTQRRHAGGRPARPRVRCRGDRPLPHRAHVHGLGPPAEDARDDHGRDRGGAARGARRAAAAPAGGLRGPLQGDGGPADHDPAARPAAARVHAAAPRRWPRTWSAPGSSRPTTSRSSSTRSTGFTRSPSPTRCSARAGCAWACSTPRSTRCRSARSSAPRSRSPSRRGSRS